VVDGGVQVMPGRQECGRGTEAVREPWVARAACRGVDPERLFVQGAEQRAATVICRHCPVQVECLADALDHRVGFGVWGGLTERERRALLRARPDVTSWGEHLQAVRADLGRNSRAS
jgi:WhiB family redox-sensing transcriptional regulator